MPSSMIHLLTAYKYNPNAGSDFYIGNIAPDSIKDKEIIHFRHYEDRLVALKNLTLDMDINSEYCRGIILHLFLDYHWDTESIRDFRLKCTQEDWYSMYREEISLAGSWLFHNENFGKRLFLEMKAHPLYNNKNILGIKVDELMDFISRNYDWHMKNNIGPSFIYTPTYIDEFTSKVVVSFKDWIKSLS